MTTIPTDSVQTLQELRSFGVTQLARDLEKGWSQSTDPTSGITGYDLLPEVVNITPSLSPLRNSIPRVAGGHGIQANWRAVTGINTGMISAGVSEGHRGGQIVETVADYYAAYRSIGLENAVTFEADFAAVGLADAKALATRNLLTAVMIQEENIILGGNSSLPLGKTPKPTLKASSTGGNLAAQTLSVICVALTYDGYWAVSGFNNGMSGQIPDMEDIAIPTTITRSNMDGSSDSYNGGSAEKSTKTTVTVSGTESSVVASVSPTLGAVGYAWFWGASGSEKLGAITSTSSVTITDTATGTQTAASLPASDCSTNALVFDGLLTQTCKPEFGGYVAQLGDSDGVAAPLSSDGAAGITEIDTALHWFWNNYRISPGVIYMSAQELVNINRKVIASGGAPLIRYAIDSANPQPVQAGLSVGSYLNKFTNQQISLQVHPTMPPGTMLLRPTEIPYPLANVINVLQIRTRQDYRQYEWPLRSRKHEYGIYTDEVLQNFFPAAFGVITNIANG